MEKITSLGLSFDRVLIQYLIPGFTACFPWFLYFKVYYYNELEYIIDNTTLLLSLISIISLTIGLIIDDLGSRVEVSCYDTKHIDNDEYKNSELSFENTWKRYLALDYNGHEPIGQRYIRNILLRMKFELSFGISLIILAVGLVFANYKIGFCDDWLIEVLIIVCIIVLAIYLLVFEAYASSKVLSDTRRLLVEKYHKNEIGLLDPLQAAKGTEVVK